MSLGPLLKRIAVELVGPFYHMRDKQKVLYM